MNNPTGRCPTGNGEALPEWCFAHHPDDGRPIILYRDEPAFREVLPNAPVERLNEALNVTPEEAAALLRDCLK